MTLRLLLTLALAALAGPAVAGGSVSFELPANPSTGYHWVLDEAGSSGLDLAVLEELGYGAPESALIGAPAPALYRLTCTAPGPVVLRFDYLSPDGQTVGETRQVEWTCD